MHDSHHRASHSESLQRPAEAAILAGTAAVILTAGAWLTMKAMPGAVWVLSVLAALCGALPA